MLYLIAHEKYRRYLEKGFYKYIFNYYCPSFRPRIIGSISDEDEELGHIAGINLRSLNFQDERSLDRYIEHIKSISNRRHKKLYIEERLPGYILIEIERKSGLEIPRAMTLKVNQIIPILEEVKEIRPYNYRNKELLIRSNNYKDTENVLEVLGGRFDFISLAGRMENIDILCEELLKSKGISILIKESNNLDLSKYEIIINLSDEPLPDKRQIRKKAIVFDFSREGVFSQLGKASGITGFNFDIKSLDLKLNQLLGHKLAAEVYASLLGEYKGKYCELLLGGQSYRIKEYIDWKFPWVKGGI